MLYLSEPVDKELQNHVVFFSKPKSAGCKVIRTVEVDRVFFADDDYSLESRKLNDDDFGPSFKDESDFEGKGIYGYMPEADVARLVGMASGGALDYDEDGDMDNGDAS